MNDRQILINAVISSLQVVVSGVILFVLYRFLYMSIGVELLGVWSVVLAASSLTHIANLGLSSSTVKFVAKYLARDQPQIASGIIQTSAITVGLIIGALLVGILPFASYLLSLILKGVNVDIALSVLPYSLLSVWIALIAYVFLGSLDGLQRVDFRNYIIMGAGILNAILCFLLVPHFGLQGVAYAQVAQSIFTLTIGWLILKIKLKSLPIVPYQWNIKLFKEMIVYGINFQVLSIVQILCDPITKAFLVKFGGLDITGFYEMANRMVLQIRALLVNAIQVIVPRIAHLQEKDPEHIRRLYKNSCRLLLYIIIPIFSVVISVSPLISIVWLGHFEKTFVVITLMLSIGWFLNMINAPAYFSYLGTGDLKWNTASHIVIGLLNVILSFSLGYYWGGIGVVLAWVLSLVVGSHIVTASYHIKYNISFISLVPIENVAIGITSLLGIGFAWYIYSWLIPIWSLPVVISSVLFVLLIMVIIPSWIHPMRKDLMKWILMNLNGLRTNGV